MQTGNFDRAFDDLIGNEGGYSNHPDDTGGETNWGITSATARNAGYAGPMRDMPKEVAKEMYRERYWRPEFDQLAYSVAFQVFDGAVNSGPTVAIKWLQRAVGAKDDGLLGPMTMAAVNRENPAAVVMRFNATRLDFLTTLPSWPSFGKGWARRISNNLRQGVS